MAKEQAEEQQPSVELKKKSNLKWIVIILALVMVIAVGTAAGLYFFMKKETAKPAAPQQLTVATWPMEAFIVNIADTNGERYLKVVIQLEVNDQHVIPELEQLKPRLRDSILDLLTSKPYKDLIDLSGKQRLREDIAGRINNSLSKGKVTKVYFTDFVIQ